ncbi:hypothetical protein JOE11_004588 [Robbsia andropogonis]
MTQAKRLRIGRPAENGVPLPRWRIPSLNNGCSNGALMDSNLFDPKSTSINDFRIFDLPEIAQGLARILRYRSV